MTRSVRLVGHVLLVFMGILVSIQFFWMIYPEEPIKYTNIKILTPVVTAGKSLAFSITLEKVSIYPATISRILLACDGSGRIYPLRIETGALPPGRHDVQFYVPIPAHVLPGRYKLRSVSCYEVNPLRNVITGFTTPCFDVIQPQDTK